MTRPIPKLNPLNIDFGQIIAAGEKRRDILGQINDVIHTKVDASLSGVVDAENFFNELGRLWDALDAEGRGLLPDEVASVMRIAGNYQGYLKTITGSKSTSSAGLTHIAQYGMQHEVAREAQVNSTLSHFPAATEFRTPDGVLRPGELVTSAFRIEYDPGWSCEDFPNGAWVAYRDDWDRSEMVPGTDPINAYANWVEQQKA